MGLLAGLTGAAQEADTVKWPILKPDTIIQGLPPVQEEEVKEVTIEPLPEYDDNEYEEEDEETADTESNNTFIPLWMSSGWKDSVKKKTIAAAYRKKLRDDPDNWYANHNFAREEKARQGHQYKEPLTAHPVFQTLLWVIIIGGFAAFVIMYLYENNIGVFRRNKTIREAEGTADETEKDIFSIAYQREIDKAVQAGNYRLAIRLHFLSALRMLADRQLIRYRTDSTNFDYLLQLNGSPYYKEFFALVRHYEYSWYGMFEVSSEQYAIVSHQFSQFQQQVR